MAHRHHIQVLGPLLQRAIDRGKIVRGADLEVLTAHLLWLFPHVAIAPALPALDPVLGPHGQRPQALRPLVSGSSPPCARPSPRTPPGCSRKSPAG